MQTYTQADVGDNTIRSSKTKTLEGCSYSYWTNYVVGVPSQNNSGAEKGNICHDILELFSFPKHRDLYDLVISSGSVYSVEFLNKLIRKKIKASQTLKPQADTLKHINDMILVGMKCDFWISGGKIIAHEYMFKLANEKPYYKIKGFFDKVAEKDDYIIIHDYKSSKRQFVGEDREANIQAMIYLLAARKLWPNKKAKLFFIFLAHPDNPMMEIEYSDETLKGFETYLGLIQEKIDNFTHKDAISSFAADHYPPNDGSFAGRLLCGYGKFPGHKNKEGKEYWVCPYKWKRDYYKILDKEGKTITTSIVPEVKLEEGQSIVKLHYAGCPRYIRNDPLKDVNPPKTIDTKGILDDF